MATVSVIIRHAGVPGRRTLTLDIGEEDLVDTVVGKLARMTTSDPTQMTVAFCGKRLHSQQKIKELMLGPQTSLNVTIRESDEFELIENDGVRGTTKALSSFYMFCKGCDKINVAKMRAYCAHCNSDRIIFLNEPESVDDFLIRGRIFVKCDDCDKRTECTFCFKCRDCHNVGSLLRHVIANRDCKECVVCGEVEDMVFALDCRHVSCVQCIGAYMQQVLGQWLFIYKPDMGFTMACPMVDCNDPHHFYLMGTDAYRSFQRKSTEKMLEIETNSGFCPFADCSAGFTVYTADPVLDNTDTTMCPECNRRFCTRCRNPGPCTCHSDEESVQLVKVLTKPCPRCKVPTERNGGCAHMRCANCNFQWCFLCGIEWNNECQWNHWLD